MPDKDPNIISGMFDDISDSYDKLNHIISIDRDKKWREKAVIYLNEQNLNINYILDLASGTGDFSKELSKLNPHIIYSVDFSYQMLLINKEKEIRNNLIICADAAKLPFKDESFDIITISFGIRNFNDIKACINEILRVLKKNGYFIVIEMFKFNKSSILEKLFFVYFSKIIPGIGGLISGNYRAYKYLQDSVRKFYTHKEFIDLAEANGFIFKNEIKNFLNIVYTIIFTKE